MHVGFGVDHALEDVLFVREPLECGREGELLEVRGARDVRVLHRISKVRS